ncbi:MAG: GNAT family protein [Candidatus Sericytochromatia bacterium]
MPEIIYKELELKDCEAYCNIRKIALATFPESFGATEERDAPVREERFKNTLKDKNNFMLGAFENNTLVGITFFNREERTKMAHKGNIYGMFVLKEKQGLGIGYNLLKLALEKAFNIDGIKQINLAVVASNDKAVNLYKKLGFKEYGLEKDSLFVNGKYFDDYLMVRFKDS